MIAKELARSTQHSNSSKLPVPPNMCNSIDNARELQGAANSKERKTTAQGHLVEENSFDMVDGPNPQPDQGFQDGMITGGVCTRGRSGNSEHEHRAWGTNLATDNNDSTYPSSEMCNSQIDSTMTWHVELDTAIDLYRAEKFEECLVHIGTVLGDNTPLYPRLRHYILLACCLDDWHKAEDMRFHAENTYTSWCLLNPTNSFPGADDVRIDLRNNLDRFANDLGTFRPEDRKETQRFCNNIEAAEAEEEYAAERAEEE
jgi:hypothetical protein